MKPIMDKPIKEKLQYAEDVLKDSVYERLVGLDMSYALTQEPVPFRERLSLSYAPIREGEVWSNSLWDCGWFHITGDIPQAPAGRALYFAFDFEGEGCVFFSDGTPLRGITNVSSQFSLRLGFPGKKYIRVSEIAQEGKKADLWIETGNNDLFGNLRTGTVK